MTSGFASTLGPVVNPETGLAIGVGRAADVPVGTQLAWGLRTRILGGLLAPGERLPTLRELADEVGVNLNTVRGVYARLEADGLVETKHGIGTFVAPRRSRGDLRQLIADTAQAASDAGLDVRDLAAALYTEPEAPRPSDRQAERRRALRGQIAALEQALGELQAKHPQIAPPLSDTKLAAQPQLLVVRRLGRP